MCPVLFLICLVLSEVGIAYGLKFLDKDFETEDFVRLQRHLDKAFQQGQWQKFSETNEFFSLFSYPCTTIDEYSSEECLDSFQNQGLRWIWKPSHSRFAEEFALESFCEVINGRDVVIIGDSSSEAFYISLLSAAWSRLIMPPGAAWTSYSEFRNTQFDNCIANNRSLDGNVIKPGFVDCGVHPAIRIGYVPSERFAIEKSIDEAKVSKRPSLEIRDDIDPSEEYSSWVNYILRERPGVIIMNTGNNQSDIEDIRRNVEESLAFIRKKLPHTNIIFRTSHAGHSDCKNSFKQSPLSSFTAGNEIKSSESFDPEIVVAKNQAIRNLLNEKFPNVLVVDIFNATMLRWDSHIRSSKDPKIVPCLHYCLPGPIDDWVLFLYNALIHVLKEKDFLIESTINHAPNNGISLHLIHEIWPLFTVNSKVYHEDNLISAYGHDAVFILKGGVKHLIPDTETLRSIVSSNRAIRKISYSEIRLIPTGRPLVSVKTT